MRQATRLYLLSLLLALPVGMHAFADEKYAEGGATKCLSCHDFGSESPVHAMLAGAHGNREDGEAPMAQRGCEDCHGPSARHSQAPTQVSPNVSFGPRWSATIAEQDKQCLTCHEANVAKHWKDALHMVNDLTCVTCHDIHKTEDRVLAAETQAEVCTVCHKPQKAGIHGLEDHVSDNPACTSCHNPHDARSAVGSMLDNRSEGCRSCHDLVAMRTDNAVTDKAKSYHKVMAQSDRTCLDCHQSVAHNSPTGVAPLLSEAKTRRDVTLFQPGQSDSEWLLTEHPGSQPLRQGSNCQQCHVGEEAQMAVALSGETSPELRDVSMSFAKNSENLLLTLSWEGPADDHGIALMWGDHDSDAFRRGGCFAACHSDMPGMSRDRGQQTGKYLSASRAQEQRIGQPAITRSAGELAQLMSAGNFVEMWRVKLKDGKSTVTSGTLLADLEWNADSKVIGTASYSGGRWTVKLQRPLTAGPGYKDFKPDSRYTLGVALHGKNNHGGKHWVSLPMTLSLNRDDTNFTTE